MKKRQSKKQTYEKRKTENKCIKCGGERTTNGSVCSDCLKKKQSETAKLKRRVVDGYGGQCSCCREKQILFLQVDHVNNDGAEDRKSTIAKQLYYRIIRENFPPEYQILCANCNIGKHLNGGTCPHQD